MREKCRIWWPKPLSCCSRPESTALFGWFLPSCPSSIDVVIAPILLSPNAMMPQLDLQEIVHSTNAKMSLNLQNKSAFSLLGYCEVSCSYCRQSHCAELVDGQTRISNEICPWNDEDSAGETPGWSCDCRKFDRLLEKCDKSSLWNGYWIQLSYNFHGIVRGDIPWIPKLHYMHQDGRVVRSCDLHVIIYEPPVLGLHHFSLNSWHHSEAVKMHDKTPLWFKELQHKQRIPNLGTVILAINCATAAEGVFKKCVMLKSSGSSLPIVSMLHATSCHVIANLLASFFTLIYLILQFFHNLLRCGLQSLIHKTVARVFGNTWKNIHIRSCQLLYWPIILQDSGFRYQSCVEYGHLAALRKHSMWSTIAMDVLFGNVLGLWLLLHIEAAKLWILNVAHDITNNLLRSGCVWLMGVPAGFKLNTELAETLGMISLNAIQIWSTIWFFTSFIFKNYIKMIALLGMVLGSTTSAALIRDTILLITLPVSTLHRFISLLYSQQMQALAALWRLFRGKKWNPLRQRFDSYDYNVEQHVVGSLLFTPLLLLLPTTSVFYIYFTILNAAISFISILIEVAVSIIHATPYAEIFLWVLTPKIFPCGIWFKLITEKNSNMLNSPEVECSTESCSSSGKPQQRDVVGCENIGQLDLHSFLCSNFADLGQIILPHYRNVFRGISPFSHSSTAYGVLTGQRIPATLNTSLPNTMPWMSISCTEYWHLCFDTLLSSMGVTTVINSR